jgi:uncharacterized membrane protein
MSTIFAPPGPARGRPRPLREEAEARRATPAGARLGAVAVPLGGMAAIAALVPLRELWPAQLALLGLLLTIPGLALLRAIRVPMPSVRATPVYLVGASLFVLMAAGLAVDLAAPRLGVDEPLRTAPLLLAVEAAIGLLAAIGAAGPAARPAASAARGSVVGLRDLWPLVLPLASAVGAARLTNGDGRAAALAAAAAAVLALAAGIVLARRLSTATLAVLVFSAGLALTWSFALRGGWVYGFDISGELPIAQATAADGVWDLAHPGDAYGAMLSLTVLPALLHAVAGVSPLVLFKALYPALFALVPVTVFLVARRHLPATYAVAAAAFVIAQANFAQQLPAVARQEIGLLLFAVLLAAVADRAIPRGSRLALIAALGLALVVSHYSTTYLTIAILAVAVVVQAGAGLLRRGRAVTAAVVVALAVTAGGAALWYGAVTDSASNIERFSHSLQEEGFRLLPDRQPGQGILGAYLTGNLGSSISAGEYEALAEEDYAETKPFVVPLPDAASPEYALREAPPTPGTGSADANRHREDALLVVLQLANVLAVAGALVLVARRRTGGGLRLLAVIALASLVSLAFVRLSGTIAANYNQDRAFLQALIPLAVGLGWMVHALARRIGWPGRLVPAVVALAIAGIAANGAGLAQAALDRPLSNLAGRGEDYERYFVRGEELASAGWLRDARSGDELIYADRYGQLRTIAAGIPAQGVFLDVTPRTLDKSAWIFATAVNAGEGRARGRIVNASATYAWPSRFIAEHWNTVYANGRSEVYHR